MRLPMSAGDKDHEGNRPGREMPRRRVPGQSWEGKAAWWGGGVAEPERARVKAAPGDAPERALTAWATC